MAEKLTNVALYLTQKMVAGHAVCLTYEIPPFLPVF